MDEKYENIVPHDTMGFFQVDGPATALENGNQKGSYYFCPNCDVHLYQADDIAYCYQQKTRSLAGKQNLFVQGKFGKINSLKKMTLPLVECMHDIAHHIDNILVECMHDIAHHIDNILVELPNHLKFNDKIKMNEMLDALNAEKERKRCCDRRKILLLLTKNMHYKIDGDVHRLLRTFSEIQRILYLGDNFRTPKEMLRLHNVCFEHFVLLKKLIRIEKSSAKMNRDKLYGKNKHNLLVHAPLQYRLVSGESINCEDEERFFNWIENITQSTTNNRPGHLIGNRIVSLEVESQYREKYEFDLGKDSVLQKIHNLGVNLHANERNTIFRYEYIQENSADWLIDLICKGYQIS